MTNNVKRAYFYAPATVPIFIEIPEEDKNKARDHFKEELDKEDKPEEMKAKILEGKLNDYFGQKTLLEQAFVKDPEMTVQGLIDGAIQKIGEKSQRVLQKTINLAQQSGIKIIVVKVLGPNFRALS